MKVIKLLILFFYLIFQFTCVVAQTKATVIKVIDGDTYQLLNGNRIFTVRLLNVDAPEKKQSFGEAAKDSVSKLILGKNIVYKSIKLDKYNRTLANIYINNNPLDSILIAKGWAWFYGEFSNKSVLQNLQKTAVNKHLGLWKCGYNKVCSPSVYRKLPQKNRVKYCKEC